MPGAAPLTSTYALSAATAPYISVLAGKGADNALAEDSGFAEGLNVKAGRIVYPAVADALGFG
jgi:alanine dehydrogenase